MSSCASVTMRRAGIAVTTMTVSVLCGARLSTYIDELKRYHNPRCGRGPVGGGNTPVRPLSRQRCRLAPHDWLHPGWSQSAYTAGGRRKPASGTDHLGPTAVIVPVGKLPTGSILGGVNNQPETEPGDAGKRIDGELAGGSARTFFEVHKGAASLRAASCRERCWMRKTSDQYRDPGWRNGELPRCFTALSPDAGTISSPVPGICCNCHGAIGNMSETADGATFNRLHAGCCQKRDRCRQAHGLNDVERLGGYYHQCDNGGALILSAAALPMAKE